MLTVECFWGFGISHYKTPDGTYKRGTLATISGGNLVKASNSTAKANVYIVDYTPTSRLPNQSTSDLDSIPQGTPVVLRNISEGVYTLSEEFFASQPSENAELEITTAGLLQAKTTGTTVAKAIRVEGTATKYRVTIAPFHS